MGAIQTILVGTIERMPWVQKRHLMLGLLDCGLNGIVNEKGLYVSKKATVNDSNFCPISLTRTIALQLRRDAGVLKARLNHLCNRRIDQLSMLVGAARILQVSQLEVDGRLQV